MPRAAIYFIYAVIPASVSVPASVARKRAKQLKVKAWILKHAKWSSNTFNALVNNSLKKRHGKVASQIINEWKSSGKISGTEIGAISLAVVLGAISAIVAVVSEIAKLFGGRDKPNPSKEDAADPNDWSGSGVPVLSEEERMAEAKRELEEAKRELEEAKRRLEEDRKKAEGSDSTVAIGIGLLLLYMMKKDK